MTDGGAWETPPGWGRIFGSHPMIVAQRTPTSSEEAARGGVRELVEKHGSGR